MKILLLDHPQFTHSTWMLYEGIIRIFGRDSVTLFPPKPSFYGDPPVEKMRLMDIRWYRDVYKSLDNLPKGIPPLSPGESLTYNDERVIDYLNAIPSSSDKTYQTSIDEDEIIELINSNEYSFIILGNSHRVPTIALARLRDRCKALPPVIYYDCGERDEFNAHWWHVFRPSLTFKSVITPELVSQLGSSQVPCEMFPMPLSHPTLMISKSYDILDDKIFSEREIDVLSSFGPTWPTRALVQDRVKEVCEKYPRKLNTILNGYLPLAPLSSKICVSMRGSGRDTERYWEFPARGAAMLCDGTMGCIHPYPFKDKETALFYRDLNELKDGIHFLLENEQERIEIAKNGYNHIRKYHSVEARTLFFLGIIREKLGISYTQEQTDKLNNFIKKLGWDSYLPEWRGLVIGYNE